MAKEFLLFSYSPTPAEELLSQRMTAYWANFPKTGDPNGAGLPLWPAYNTTTEPLVSLDDQIGTVNGYHRAQCAFMDPLTPFAFGGFGHGRKVGLFDHIP